MMNFTYKRGFEGFICILIAVMVAIQFPIQLADSVVIDPIQDDQKWSESTRANEVTVNEIVVTTAIPFEVSGVNGNGEYVVAVNFTLTQDMMNVNMTMNVTNPSVVFETNITEKGNLSAGNHKMILGHLFNFTDPGLYTINATVGGWCNATAGMVYGYLELVDVNFTTIIHYNVDISIQGNEYQGYYGRDMLTISAVVNNSGNAFNEWINVTINISNETWHPEMDVNPKWRYIGELWPGNESNPVTFSWMPSAEGEYFINITATNETTWMGNLTTIQVQVMNVTTYTPTLEIMDDTINEGESLEAWINVTNTGNVGHDFLYTVNISKTGWSMEEMLSTGWLDPGVSHTHPYVNVIAEPGAYTISVDFDDTGTDPFDTITVLAVNHAPFLSDTTVLEDVIMTGDLINFTLFYTDGNGDVGDVRVKFDMTVGTRGISGGGSYHAMNFNPSGNFSQGVTYWYLASFDTPGNYTYTFNVTDVEANETVVENGTGFNVILAVPDEGELYGKVTSRQGNTTIPVTNADIIIYYYDNNTNATNYYNTTTNATGHYSKTLPIVEEPYFVTVNATGFFDHEKFKLHLLTIDNNVEKNFILEPWEPEAPEDTTGELGGFVLDADGAIIEGATIIVVIYTMTTEQQNISGNLTNITAKSYTNFTTTSNATGAFLIEGIAPGTWNVMVRAAEYKDKSENITFTTAHINMNFTLTATDYEVKVGPFKDGDGDAVEGATVTFTLNGVEYSAKTDANGKATFTLLVAALPAGTKLHATKDDNEITWTQGEDIPTLIPATPTTYEVTYGPWPDFAGWELSFVINNQTIRSTVNDTGYVTVTLPNDITVPAGHDFVLKKGDEEVRFKEGEEPKISGGEKDDGISLWVWIVIAIVVVATIALVLFFLMKKKGIDEIRELEEELDELDEGQEEDQKPLKDEGDSQELIDESDEDFEEIEKDRDETDEELDELEENDNDDVSIDDVDFEEDHDESDEETVEFEEDDFEEDHDESDEEIVEFEEGDFEEWEDKNDEDDEYFDESEPPVSARPPPPVDFDMPPPPSTTSPRTSSYVEKLSLLNQHETSQNIKKMIPGFIITHKIGAGGFATVYKAINDEGDTLALKVPKFLDETLDISVLRKFEAEANMWKKLKHQNIVKFYDTDIRPVPYMAIELMEGGNLNQLMKNHTFDVNEAIEIMLQILSGMAFAHRMASVHRDIKPENILFTKDGIPKITDWGIGKFMASEGLSKTIGAKGTLAYGSPEQISKKKYGDIDWQTDVFQLGIVFYEMLTGENPFYDDEALGIMSKITGETPDAPSEINPEVPKYIDNIVLKALEKDKKNRWSSAEVMYDRMKMALKRKKDNVKKYKRTLIRALKDGIISEDEKEMLAELREHFNITMMEHHKLLNEVRNEN